ncbi:MAG: ATP-binding protein [Thermomicrobiales bacterium]
MSESHLLSPPHLRAHHGLTFLDGGGETGALIPAVDWAATPLGPPETWPQTLKTVVRLMLSTRHPMFIFWGAERTCLYNDAYRASIGPEKHPAILGAPGEASWPEIWDVIGPQIDHVMRGDGATWHENQLVPIVRHGGLQDVYWTYSYGPIDEPDAPGGVGGVLVVCTETTAQVLAEQRRGEDLDRLRALFAQVPGFMCVLRGPDHRYELANAAYSELVGGREFAGKSIREAFPEAADQGFVDLLDGVYRTGVPYVARALLFTFQHASAAPNERFLDFVYQPIRDETGAITGIFCEGSDVTERVRGDGERRALLDVIAHDLKTPLTTLKAQAQLLVRQIGRRGVPEAGALTARVELFNRLADRMADQIGELSDHARVLMGQPIEVDRQPTDLVALIAGAIDEFRQSGDPHAFRFGHETDELIGEWDAGQLRRVAANLIGNAVKYSSGGGEIAVGVRAEDGDAVLTVRDAGIGVPEADLARIFAVRSRGGNVGSIPGSGIGLAGVKRIVERHGGTVAVASGEGSGTTFTVRLPLAP